MVLIHKRNCGMWSVPGHSPYGGAGGTTPPSVTPFTSAILDDTYILAKYEGHTITAAQVSMQSRNVTVLAK